MKRIVRNDAIGRNLAKRFDMDQTGPSSQFQISESIVLTHPLDDMLQTPASQFATATAVSLNSSWEVPRDERWHLKSASTYRAEAGACLVQMIDPSGVEIHELSYETSTTYAIHMGNVRGTIAPSGWTVNVYALTGVSGVIRNGLIYNTELVEG